MSKRTKNTGDDAGRLRRSAWRINEVIRASSLIDEVRQQVREWVAARQKLIDAHKAWDKGRTAHNKKTAQEERLRDHTAGPPEPGWEWEGGRKSGAWFPPELTAEAEPDTSLPLPLRERQPTDTEKWTLLAAIHDCHCSPPAEPIDPFPAPRCEQYPPPREAFPDELKSGWLGAEYHALIYEAGRLTGGDAAWVEALLHEVASSETPPPLTDTEKAALDAIRGAPPDKGILGKEIISKLSQVKIEIDLSTLTGRIIPRLKKFHGVKNRPRAGYYDARKQRTQA